MVYLVTKGLVVYCFALTESMLPQVIIWLVFQRRRVTVVGQRDEIA